MLRAYTQHQGNMTRVFDHVLLSDPALDSHRFMDMMQDGINEGRGGVKEVSGWVDAGMVVLTVQDLQQC